MRANEIRDRVNSQLLDLLSRGTIPWRCPWRNDPQAGAPANARTKRAYRGINHVILTASSLKRGFQSCWWLTYRQAQAMGAQIRLGEKATHVVLFKPIQTIRTDENGEETEETFRLMRSFCVFNAEQCLGLDHLHVGNETVAAGDVQARFEQAERVVQNTEADIRYGGNRAFYDFGGDFIQMPHRQQFSLPEFYDTLLHELAHWTEHRARLDWDRKKPENTYALGELIAELGACYLAGELGLALNDTLPSHAAYLQGWLERMKSDSRFIFTAAAQASRAVDFIMSFSRVAEPEPEQALV
jgi:antirestriction protein ArdC